MEVRQVSWKRTRTEVTSEEEIMTWYSNDENNDIEKLDNISSSAR